MTGSGLDFYFRGLKDTAVSARDIPLAIIGKCGGQHSNCDEYVAAMVKEDLERAVAYYDGMKRGFYPNTQKMEDCEKWFIKHGEFAFGDDEVRAMIHFYDFCEHHCGKPEIIVYEKEPSKTAADCLELLVP